MPTPLPVDDCLPELLAILREAPNAVLAAPPGAGKTTRVPLALLEIIPPTAGRIIMLEPRRIAAASAARYMALCLGEQPGQTVGYTIRFESRVSPTTRIEVVTEGVLTRRIQNDPELTGVACVIFDEFHERSIHADLGLALCLEAQAALRPDLKLLVMSATLDCGPISRLMGEAPIIRSEGRQHPVELRYLAASNRQPLPQRMATAIRKALAEESGDLLAFLPGAGELRAVAAELADLPGIRLCPLYGELPFEQQQLALLPGPHRRVILATNIAETSLTIDGVRIVVDCGLTRRLQLDPATSLERLVTVKASQASAAQRSGRAGRTAPGVCYRLYSEHSLQAMTPFTPPEILTADLASLLLELAAWGIQPDAVEAGLRWLDPPPPAHGAAARELLQLLGALDAGGLITPSGRQMVRLPLHPRLAKLLILARGHNLLPAACSMAAALSNRATAHAAIARTEQQLLQLMGERTTRFSTAATDQAALAPLLAAAWPDRIAQRRVGDDGRYLLASGRGASNKTTCQAPLLVALQVDGGAGANGVIHQAVAVTETELRQQLPHLVIPRRLVGWDQAGCRVAATEQERIGAIVLVSRQVVAQDHEAIPLLLEQLRSQGMGLLGWNGAAKQLQARALLARQLLPEEGWPDLSDTWLMEHLELWLAPHLGRLRSLQDLQQLSVVNLLHEILGWNMLQLLNKATPTTLLIPSGRQVALDYTADEGPVLSVKLQELFGMAVSPTVCYGRRALLVHLLSPAGRPVAVTRDLQGFWQRGYQDVRKELRGRYPKHPWPEDPWNAVATHKTKKALDRS